MAADLTGILLAGGRSTRFGSDKATALLAGRPLLAHVVEALALACDEIVVVRARGQQLPAISVPVRIIEDEYEAAGPLAGIVTGLTATTTPLAFVVSTDAPLLRPALVDALAARARATAADVVCPHASGYPQPLVSIYRVETCLQPFREAVDAGNLKITTAFSSLLVEAFDEASIRAADPGLDSFLNANTPEALDAIADRLARS